MDKDKQHVRARPHKRHMTTNNTFKTPGENRAVPYWQLTTLVTEVIYIRCISYKIRNRLNTISACAAKNCNTTKRLLWDLENTEVATLLAT
jgi:hypothetical protein